MARGRAIPLGGRPRPGARIAVKLLLIALILVLVAGLVLVGAGGFFTYQIVTARDDVETVTPSSFLLSRVDTLSFTDTDGEQHDGWLLRGLRGAPVVILCHGYDSNRSEMLSVGTMLQDNRFNVYLFNFLPSQSRHRISDLGVRQAKVLDSAIATVTRQEGINPRRLGLFGKNTGGYASLAVAEHNPLVKALAVVNVYESPLDMFNAQIDQSLGSTPVFRIIADTEFRLLNLRSDPPAVGANISKLNGMAKFFVSGRDVPSLASTTEKFYGLASQPKRLLVLDRSQAALETGAERKELENQLLIFFQQNLPLRAD